MNERYKVLGGEFEMKIYKDKDAFKRGEIQDCARFKNSLTNASMAVITGLVGNVGSQTAFGYVELGTSSTAVAHTQTALVAAITDSGLARTATTNSRTTSTSPAVTNDTLSMAPTTVWTASGSKTIEEIGIFNASSNGVMLCRALTGSHAVVSGNVVTAVYTITFIVD